MEVKQFSATHIFREIDFDESKMPHCDYMIPFPAAKQWVFYVKSISFFVFPTFFESRSSSRNENEEGTKIRQNKAQKTHFL